MQLWTTSVEKGRLYGTRAELLGQAHFEGEDLLSLLEGSDAAMGTQILPAVRGSIPLHRLHLYTW